MHEATRGRGPGQWWPSGHDGKVTSATLYCPNCGTPLGMWRHNIGADGTVTPSIDAPVHNPPGYFEHDGCRFHENVRLIGWDGGACPGREVHAP